MSNEQKKLFLAIPTYNNLISIGTCRSTWRISNTVTVTVATWASSLLTQAFNALWCTALNAKADYFLMLHADVEVSPNFADIMIEEMIRTNADIVGVVAPLKDAQGYTSIGVETLVDEEYKIRKLTMKDIFKLPKTFVVDDIPFAGPNSILLLNTGCMLVDMKKDWVNKVLFHIDDFIIDNDGEWISQTNGEDWNFSHDVARLGGKLVATRKVELIHHGVSTWSNKEPWGTLDTDVERVAVKYGVG